MIVIVYELYLEYNKHACKGVQLIMVYCKYEVYGHSAIMFDLFLELVFKLEYDMQLLKCDVLLIYE